MRAIAVPVLVMTWLIAHIPIAASADFTFNVPVDLENLAAAVQSYQVTCQATDNNPLVNNPPWKMIGTGSTSNQVLPAGQKIIKATHTIAFNFSPSFAPSAAAAKWYQCYLVLCSAPTTCQSAKVPG